MGDAARQGTDGLDLLHLHEVAVQLLGLHGAGNDVGDGQHLRGEGRRNVARVAVEDADEADEIVSTNDGIQRGTNDAFALTHTDERAWPRLRRVVQDELVQILVRLFEHGKRPLGCLELLNVVRGEVERALEDEVRGAVVLGDPDGYDVAPRKAGRFFRRLLLRFARHRVCRSRRGKSG